MNAVAKNLKTIRTQKGYTQDDLAEALHVTRQTVSSWETGRSEPDIGMLTALAEFLQTDVTSLIYGPSKPPYRTMQKKYKAWCVVLGLAVLGGVAAYLWLRPWLIAYKGRTFDSVPYYLYLTGLIPLCAAAFGALLPCILSLWTNTAIRRPWRCLLLALGILALVPALGTALQFVPSIMPQDNGGRSQWTLWFPFVWSTEGFSIWTRAVPFLGGICLFLGLNRETE